MFVRPFVPPLLAAVLTVITLGLALHRGWLITKLWIFSLVVLPLAYITVIALFTIMLWLARRSTRRWSLVATALIAFAGIGAPVFFHYDYHARVAARFWIERPAFTAAATVTVPEGEYYGTELPSHLCFVSANCRVAIIGTSNGHPVRFAPDWLGIPDDAVGYGHFTGTPEPGKSYDGFGMEICPTFELSDGWWWLEACPRGR